MEPPRRCDRCRSLVFRARTDPRKGRVDAGKPGYYAVLHRDQQSLETSLRGGCQFCHLVSGQLGTTRGRNELCDEFDAEVLLKLQHFDISRQPNTPWSLTVISRRGVLILHEVKDIASDEAHLRVAEQYIAQFGNAMPGGYDESDRPAPFNVNLAKLWLKDCLSSHERCNEGSLVGMRSLPRRLVNIGDMKRPFLQVAFSDSEVSRPYIALSYSWGQGNRYQTFKTNFNSHLGHIPIASAPKTFRDAMEIAHRLGYEWIWIDALCIIQDCRSDLERELANMGKIYRHASFTIYAQGAPSAQAGLLKAMDPKMRYPCRLCIKIEPPDNEGDILERTVMWASNTRHDRDYLVKRGWILQEEILSSRFLKFGDRGQMSWTCAEAHAHESYILPKAITSPPHVAESGRASSNTTYPIDAFRMWLFAPAKMSTTLKDTHSLSLRRWGKYEPWYAMLEQYSDKELSFHGDILRALSGLTQGISSTYLAGLWKEDILTGLAWYVYANDDRRDVTLMHAPSWSWASVGKVRVRFVSLLWQQNTHQPALDCAKVIEAFCEHPDPISAAQKQDGQRREDNSIAARSSRPTGNWMLNLKVPVKPAILKFDLAYSVWRTEHVSKGRRGHAVFEFEPLRHLACHGVHPRFPALLLSYDGVEHGPVIGEVAADGPSTSQLMRKDAMIDDSAGRDGVICKNVWCVPLQEAGFGENKYLRCLVVERNQSSSYHRLGLAFVRDKLWIDTCLGQQTKRVDCEIV